MEMLVKILARAFRGKFPCRRGSMLTVAKPTQGYYPVDRGMLSTTVDVPLEPGDRFEFVRAHSRETSVVLIAEQDAGLFLKRVSDPLQRSWIGKGRLLLYVASDMLKRADAH